MLTLSNLLFIQVCQITLLALVVWSLTRLFARNRPHLAHALWMLVLLKCVTPPIWSSPASPFSWLATDWHQTVHSEPENMHQPLLSIDADHDSQRYGLKPIVVHARPASERPEILESQSKQPGLAFSQLDWQQTIGVLWIASAGLALLTSATRFALFSFWLRQRTRYTDPTIDQIVSKLSAQFGIRLSVRTIISECSVGPAVLGVFRPTILLPASIVRNSKLSELETLLAHELIHIRRGDLWWAMVQTIAINLFWFHPLVWIATQRVTRESERSCDEETIANLGCQPTTYARVLLDILSQKQQLRTAPALPGIRPVDITSTRLERIMNLGTGSHKKTPVWIWCLMLISGIIVLPGAAFVTGQENTKPSVSTEDVAKLPTAEPKSDRVEQQPGTEQSTSISQSDEQIVVTYKVADVAEKLAQTQDIDQHLAEQGLLSLLKSLHPAERSSLPTDDNQAAPSPQQRMVLYEGKLVVSASVARQASIRDTIDSFREHGFEQLSVETRFVTVPKRKLGELNINWSFADPHVSDVTHADRINVSPIKPDHKHSVTAASYIEKSPHVLHAVLDADKTKKLLAKLVESETMIAPKVTMFNGREAVVKDVAKQPFVVSVNKVTDERGAAWQPIIRVIESGTQIQLNPVLNGETVELNCSLALLNIQKVELFTFEPALGEPSVTVQIPEVAETHIHSTLNVPLNQTLLICNSPNFSEQDEKALLVFVTCHRVDAQTIPAPSPAPAAQFHEAKNLTPATVDTAPIAQPAKPVQEPSALYIRSQEKTADDEPATRTVEAMGFKLHFTGKVHPNVA